MKRRHEVGEHMPDPESREPLLTRAGLTAAVGAVLAAAASFGLPLSELQQGALTTALVAVAPLVAAVWARRHAWSGATVAERVTRPRGER